MLSGREPLINRDRDQEDRRGEETGGEESRGGGERDSFPWLYQVISNSVSEQGILAN